MEDISFRVSKLENLIKGNVKINALAKLENKMASKEDLKGIHTKEDLKIMDNKEDVKDMARK